MSTDKALGKRARGWNLSLRMGPNRAVTRQLNRAVTIQLNLAMTIQLNRAACYHKVPKHYTA